MSRPRRRTALALVLVALVLAGLAGRHAIKERILRATYAQSVPALLGAPAPPAGATVVGHAVEPKHLFIPALGVNAPVDPRPSIQTWNAFTQREETSFGIPNDAYTTTWWSQGPKPGDPSGLAVVLGHTELGTYGVFNQLADLRPGASIGITGDLAVLRYAVVEVRTGLAKRDPDALRQALANPPAGASLALVTCSGDFDSQLRSHDDNTVVFAALVATG